MISAGPANAQTPRTQKPATPAIRLSRRWNYGRSKRPLLRDHGEVSPPEIATGLGASHQTPSVLACRLPGDRLVQSLRDVVDTH